MSRTHSPAYGTLAVSWPLCHAQGLSYLGLRQTQRQSAKLEHLSELLDLVQIYPVDYVVRGLIDRRLICNQRESFLWWDLKLTRFSDSSNCILRKIHLPKRNEN